MRHVPKSNITRDLIYSHLLVSFSSAKLKTTGAPGLVLSLLTYQFAECHTERTTSLTWTVLILRSPPHKKSICSFSCLYTRPQINRGAKEMEEIGMWDEMGWSTNNNKWASTDQVTPVNKKQCTVVIVELSCTMITYSDQSLSRCHRQQQVEG